MLIIEPVSFTFTQSSGDKLGHRCISTYAGLCLAQLSPMLFDFSARFHYAVASKHWGASRGFALIMGFRSGSSALTVGRRTACCCGLQVLRVITGYVCSFLFSCQRQALGLVLGEFFGGSRSFSDPARGPFAPQALRLEREVWWLPLTGLSWLPYALGSGARGPTIFPGTFPKLIYC